MRRSRRLSLQLTPLLDLLLIVIFAQYMEVQQTVESGSRQVSTRQQQLEQDYRRREQELESVHQAAMVQLQQAQRRHQEQLDSLVAEHDRAAERLAEALKLPEQMMQEVVRMQASGQTDDAARLQRVAEQLRAMLQQRGTELLHFVIQYDEMRKHVSVWELHLLDSGEAIFSDGQLTRRIDFASAGEFSSRCLEASKSFADPLPLTLILMSHGDTQAGIRRDALNGLPELVRLLRDDANGMRWFDYSLLGFRPDGPISGRSLPAP